MKKTEKCIPESKETPADEAKHHSTAFLKRAASLTESKSRMRKGKKKSSGHKVARKKV